MSHYCRGEAWTCMLSQPAGETHQHLYHACDALGPKLGSLLIIFQSMNPCIYTVVSALGLDDGTQEKCSLHHAIILSHATFPRLLDASARGIMVCCGRIPGSMSQGFRQSAIVTESRQQLRATGDLCCVNRKRRFLGSDFLCFCAK